MHAYSRLLVVLSIAAVGCSKLHSAGVPGVPGGSGEVDPNTCGNYAASDAGAKLKVFLQATKDLQTATIETAKVVKQSCIMMGQQLQMSDADLGGNDTGAICNKVIATIKNNLTVTVKTTAALKIAFTPGKCTVDASASASASASCGGSAGNGGASGQCQSSAAVNASLHAECTPPSLDIEIAQPKLVVDASKLKLTIDAMKAGLPQLFSIKARMEPISAATQLWVASAKDLAAMGPKAAQSFGDQATCILGQAAATAQASTQIQANVNVSVSVSASASGTVGG